MSREFRRADQRSGITRNSRPGRSASGSSTDRRCRHCSDRRKSRAGRNNASRRHSRNIAASGRCTRAAGSAAPAAAAHPSGHTAAACCSAAAGTPAGNHSHAISAPAASEPVRPKPRQMTSDRAMAVKRQTRRDIQRTIDNRRSRRHSIPGAGIAGLLWARVRVNGCNRAAPCSPELQIAVAARTHSRAEAFRRTRNCAALSTDLPQMRVAFMRAHQLSIHPCVYQLFQTPPPRAPVRFAVFCFWR